MWTMCSIVKAVICELEEERQLALLMLAVLPGTFTLSPSRLCWRCSDCLQMS